ncbi:Hypothetical predicted protein [Lecanosticta acicola]|uniref:Uncharacterized protein n=1 Tax=Lecanosticta acicola TaxID=111012 RepID=A0AAI8Z399_9PEZI|nr:Hypothetical predicted protein [Lecanosticta acicola]
MNGLDLGNGGLGGVHAALGDGGTGVSVGGLGVGSGTGINSNNGIGVGVNGNGDAIPGANSGAGVNVGSQSGGTSDGMNAGGVNGLYHLGGAADASGPPCTVQGGPARLIYFPPPGDGTPIDSEGTAVESPIEAWGNTFNPDYCYLSVETLYATLAPSGTVSAATTVGPTFTNAIFPFRSSEISTLCQSTSSTSASNAGATYAASSSENEAGQVDFGGLSAGAESGEDSCRNIVAPPRFAAVVPEWSGGLFWNLNFEAPIQLSPQVAHGPPPSGGQPCQQCPRPASPASANTPSPTICTAGWDRIPGGPPWSQAVTATTAPSGVRPSMFGHFTPNTTRPGTPTPSGVGPSVYGQFTLQTTSPSTPTPVGTSPATATVGTSLGVAPIGTSPCTTPVGNNSVVAPIGISSGVAPIGSSAVGAPIGASSGVAPLGTGIPNSFTTGPALPPNATATGTSPAPYTGAAANVPVLLDAGRGISSLLVGVLLFSLGIM